MACFQFALQDLRAAPECNVDTPQLLVGIVNRDVDRVERAANARSLATNIFKPRCDILYALLQI